MKKFLSLVFACTAATFTFGQSPIVLEKSDFATGGDSYYIVNANPTISFDGTETGPDYNWDFSDLEVMTATVTNFEDPTDTDPLYFFLWLSSDVAQQNPADIANDFITIEDVFNFYKLNNDEFAQTGFAGTISDIPLPISYDNNEILYQFPSAYSDNTSSEAGFSISVPGFGGWSESRSRTNENDGWGTITTPAGEFEVLRTKSEIDIVEIPFGYTAVEYRWMAKNEGMPVLQINSQVIFGFETITQVTYKTADVIDGIENGVSSENNFVVYPNPAATSATIQFTTSGNAKYLISISDLQGKIIFEKNISALNGENSIATDLQSFAAGTYLVSLFENNQLIASQKIIKN